MKDSYADRWGLSDRVNGKGEGMRKKGPAELTELRIKNKRLIDANEQLEHRVIEGADERAALAAKNARLEKRIAMMCNSDGYKLTERVRMLEEALRERRGYYYERDVPHQFDLKHCKCRECTDKRCDAALAGEPAPVQPALEQHDDEDEPTIIVGKLVNKIEDSLCNNVDIDDYEQIMPQIAAELYRRYCTNPTQAPQEPTP